MNRFVTFALWFTVMWCVPAISVAHARPWAQPPSDGVAPPVGIEQLHWAVRLGFRSHRLTQGLPVVDRVVLVPDAAAYVEELSRWSITGGIWPVLFEDDHLAPMFIRAFKPASIIRRERVNAGTLPNLPDERWAMLEERVLRFWRLHDDDRTLVEAMARHQLEPNGLVISSPTDPGWTAALALALGRGQLLMRLDGDFGRANQAIPRPRLAEIEQAMRAALDATRLPYEQLGDAIDAITICRALAGRVQESDQGVEPQVFSAATDALARRHDGLRYAFVGWIHGSETRSAYMAMCSLFLARAEAAMLNTYPDTGAWGQYDIIDAAGTLSQRGLNVEAQRGERAHLALWRRTLAGGFDRDLLFINSKGNADYWDFADGRGYPNDVPILNRPLAAHVIHSWSLRQPDVPSTVGGAFLDHGAYAYVGSMQEPYLQAFIPPGTLAQRIAGGVPFLVAARHWEAPPWKVATIGDPLMLIHPALPERRPPGESAEGVDVRARAADVLRRARDGDTDAFAEGFRLLDLLGEDRLALNLVPIAKEQDAFASSARAALPMLFRLRRYELFIEAFETLRDPSPRERTMLWHLLMPRLEARADPDHVLLLVNNLREPLTHADLERLLPAMRAAFDVPYARTVIEREIARTQSDLNRRNLQRLLPTAR